jgi:hypothetical protein
MADPKYNVKVTIALCILSLIVLNVRFDTMILHGIQNCDELVFFLTIRADEILMDHLDRFLTILWSKKKKKIQNNTLNKTFL